MLFSILRVLGDSIVMRKNPPTPGYDNTGSGSYAVAYFYPNKTVELILTEDEFHNVDWSREVMILARVLAPAEAKKHLPDIRRLRFEQDDDELEFVYKMPLYSNTCTHDDADSADAAMDNAHSGIVNTTLEKAVKAIIRACKILRLPFNDDIVRDNISHDKDGVLVLRDPIFIEAPAANLAKRWKDLGFVCKASIIKTQLTYNPEIKETLTMKRICAGKYETDYKGYHIYVTHATRVDDGKPVWYWLAEKNKATHNPGTDFATKTEAMLAARSYVNKKVPAPVKKIRTVTKIAPVVVVTKKTKGRINK